MDLLDNPVHRDAWGSTTAIPQFLGEDPDGEPRSELWMGAHPSSSSRLSGNPSRSLAEAIAADPAGTLGAAVVDAYGPRLPFLLKVLAAARALSLQAHPSPEQAASGFADEERRGVSLDDPSRNYADANHKPEMICALTEFHALCGFRPVDDALAMITKLGVDALAPDIATMSAHPDADGVRTVLDRLLHLPTAEREPLVRVVAERCAAATWDGQDVELARTVVELAEQYPDDVGVVCALLMNRVTLQPGEAISLAAGNLHAYLRGVGVEIMASSDNVLRAGLTARHVDADELLAIVDTTPGEIPLVSPVLVDDVQTSYPVPVRDFALSRLVLPAGRSYELDPGRPQILLVVDGELVAEQAGSTRRLGRGQAFFVPADDPPVVLSGPATAFLATTSG